MTFCPHDKLIGNATSDYQWQCGEEKGGRGGAATPGSGTDYGYYERPCGGGNSYGHSDGRRSNSPPLAGADKPSQGISLLRVARQNKGLHRTAHKLPNLCGFAMIHPVEATHYCACAPPGEP